MQTIMLTDFFGSGGQVGMGFVSPLSHPTSPKGEGKPNSYLSEAHCVGLGTCQQEMGITSPSCSLDKSHSNNGRAPFVFICKIFKHLESEIGFALPEILEVLK